MDETLGSPGRRRSGTIAVLELLAEAGAPGGAGSGRWSESLLRLLAQVSHEFLYSHDRDGFFTHVSESVESVTGYSVAEWCDHYTRYLTSNPLNRAGIAATEGALADGRARPPYCLELRHKDGHTIRLEICEFPVHGRDGVTGLTGVARDVTQEDELLGECRKLLLRYRTLFESSRDAILLTDAETGLVVDVNPAAERLSGRRAEDLIGQPQRILHPAHDVVGPGDWDADGDGSTPWSGELLTVVRPDGTERSVESGVSTLQEGGRLLVQSIMRDATRRRKSLDLLRGLIAQLSAAFASAPLGMCMVDSAGHILRANAALAAMTGRADDTLPGASVLSLFDDDPTAGLGDELGRLLGRQVTHFTGRFCLQDAGRPVLLHAGCIEGADGITPGAVLLLQDLSKAEAARSEADMQRSRADSIFAEMTTALALTIEKRDPYTAGHQSRVSRIACAIARRLGLPESTVEGIRIGAQLHDIGKISVPSEILNYPGRLSASQLEIVRQHPLTGHEIVRDVSSPWKIQEIILQHHERLDGSGYPAGLAGGQICIEARIVAVADVAEAMSSHRPFRPALGVELVQAELAAGRDRLYDPAAVDACLELLRDPAAWASL